MSNQVKAGNKEYSFLEKRTIHELEELLHIALQDTSADEAYLSALEAAILRRETGLPTGRLSDTDKAWDKFRSLYLAGDAEKFALSDEVVIPETVIPSKKTRQPRVSRRLRRALLIAAVIVLVITLLLPPALGHRDIFQMVAQWTDEQFRFVPPAYGSPRTAEESSYLNAVTPLMQSLEEHDLPLSLAPAWFPEDRHLSDVQFDEYEDGTTIFTAIFTDDHNDRAILFDLTKSSQPGITTWEKDDRNIIEFSCNGITHYIMTNNDTVSAVWYRDPFEVSVSGHISIDEAKAIIESVYKKETGYHKDAATLMDSLEDHDLPPSLAPTWFPEDRQLAEVKFREAGSGIEYFTAIFRDENEEHVIFFNLLKYSETSSSRQSPSAYEKDDGDIIEFSCNGITHYIMTNNGLVNAVWFVDRFEASVCGHISIEDAKTIIKSIYER